VSLRRLACVLAVSLGTVGGATTAVMLARDDGRAAASRAPTAAAITAGPPSSTAATVATSTTAPSVTLPAPDAPPEDPYAAVPVTRLGAISIPKIGLQHDIYEGIWLTVLNHGPGHWPNSALPGQPGNTVFPGHRTTYSHPFLNLDHLVPGDEVIFQMPDADYVYVVRETLIVVPKDMWVVDPTATPTMTLIACHPKGSAAQRIVVKGDLVTTVPH
jgi:sortase A